MITLEPVEDGIKRSGEPERLGKRLSLFFLPQSEWKEAQDFIFNQNEERGEAV